MQVETILPKFSAALTSIFFIFIFCFYPLLLSCSTNQEEEFRKAYCGELGGSGRYNIWRALNS